MVSKKLKIKFENIGVRENGSNDKKIAINQFNWLFLCIFFASGAWSLMLFLINQPTAAIIPLIAVGIVPFAFLIFQKTKNFNLHLDFFLLIIIIFPAVVQLFNGGFINSGAVISWSALGPITSLAFKSTKGAVKCFVLFILVVLSAMTVELFYLPAFNTLSSTIVKFQFMMNLLGVVSIGFFPLLQFARELKDTRKTVKSSNKKIIDSINYAKYIQNAILLSKQELNELLGNNSVLFYEPKDIVSGDFYWAHQSGDDVFLVCGDCTGHGVPGAFMTMIGINHLNSIVRENKESDPSKILTYLHEKVVSSLKSTTQQIHDGMDISICKINFKTKVVEYASAMSKVLLDNGSEIIACPIDKSSVGDSRRDISYQNYTLQMEEGQSLYLATDGYYDQFGGERDKKFGSKRVFKLLNRLNKIGLDEQYSAIETTFKSWKGDRDQLDDVTLIGVHF